MNTEFEYLRGDEGRMFLRIFPEGKGMHIMVEVDAEEIADLRDVLTRPPKPMNRNRGDNQ